MLNLSRRHWVQKVVKTIRLKLLESCKDEKNGYTQFPLNDCFSKYCARFSSTPIFVSG